MPNQAISDDLDLLGRVENGASLTTAQGDQNLTDVEEAVNGIKEALRVSMKDDGTFKPNSINADAVVPGALGQTYKVDAGAANAVLITFTVPFATLASLTGIPLYIKAAYTNTAATTLKVDGLAITALQYYAGKEVVAGDIQAGQVFVAVFDGTIFQFLGSVAPQNTTAPVGMSSFRNLLIVNNSGSPNTQLDITIDEATLRSATGRYITVTGVSKTLDMAAAAAINGREGAYSEPADAWTYVWLGVTEDGATVGTFFGASASALTVSAISGWSGDVYALLLGAWRQTGSNLVSMVQQDREVYELENAIFDNQTGTASYALLSGAALTAFQVAVPPIAKRCRGSAGSASPGDDAYISVAGTSTGIGAVNIVIDVATNSLLSFDGCAPFSCPLVTAQNLYWRTFNTSVLCRMTISGFTI